MLRLPGAWAHGRFLDEEGAIFFAYAWHRPTGEALLRSFGGYLNLGANAVTLLDARLVRAGVLPLEQAPRLTMAVALMVQLVPAVLVVTGRAGWLRRQWAVLASLAVLVACPMTEEVFANVLHLQFHLALAAALILALEPPASRWSRLGYGAVLLLAPLCGLGAIVLLPFFVLRAAVERDQARWAQTAVLAAGAAVQLLFFFGHSPVRGQILDPAAIVAVMTVRLAALPLGSPCIANDLGRWVAASRDVGGAGWWGVAAAGLVYFGAVAATALRDRRDAAVWLIGPALAIAAVVFGGGMVATRPAQWFGVVSGKRYQFLPLVLLTLGLVALSARTTGRLRRVWMALWALTLLSGATVYARPLVELNEGPAWTAEVAAWRRDHDRPLRVWPALSSVDLSNRDRPCPTDTAASPPPDYCEAAWIAKVARR